MAPNLVLTNNYNILAFLLLFSLAGYSLLFYVFHFSRLCRGDIKASKYLSQFI